MTAAHHHHQQYWAALAPTEAGSLRAPAQSPSWQLPGICPPRALLSSLMTPQTACHCCTRKYHDSKIVRSPCIESKMVQSLLSIHHIPSYAQLSRTSSSHNPATPTPPHRIASHCLTCSKTDARLIPYILWASAHLSAYEVASSVATWRFSSKSSLLPTNTITADQLKVCNFISTFILCSAWNS